MTDTRLARRPDRGRPALSLAPEMTPDMTLALARVHEACGRARRSFALWLAARTEGPVFWIVPGWLPDRPNPEGMQAFANPSRFTFITPRRPEDVLWCMEEVLRAGAVPLAVADLTGLPGLTAVRRMHLAAETGAGAGHGPPLGLLLTPGDGGAPGVESRWRMEPAATGGWALTRLRARTAPVKDWHVAATDAGPAPGPAKAA